jgi:hypothetical protein
MGGQEGGWKSRLLNKQWDERLSSRMGGLAGEWVAMQGVWVAKQGDGWLSRGSWGMGG